MSASAMSSPAAPDGDHEWQQMLLARMRSAREEPIPRRPVVCSRSVGTAAQQRAIEPGVEFADGPHAAD